MCVNRCRKETALRGIRYQQHFVSFVQQRTVPLPGHSWDCTQRSTTCTVKSFSEWNLWPVVAHWLHLIDAIRPGMRLECISLFKLGKVRGLIDGMDYFCKGILYTFLQALQPVRPVFIKFNSDEKIPCPKSHNHANRWPITNHIPNGFSWFFC